MDTETFLDLCLEICEYSVSKVVSIFNIVLLHEVIGNWKKALCQLDFPTNIKK